MVWRVLPCGCVRLSVRACVRCVCLCLFVTGIWLAVCARDLRFPGHPCYLARSCRPRRWASGPPALGMASTPRLGGTARGALSMPAGCLLRTLLRRRSPMRLCSWSGARLPRPLESQLLTFVCSAPAAPARTSLAEPLLPSGGRAPLLPTGSTGQTSV